MAGRLHEMTGGNPLLVTQAAAALSAAGEAADLSAVAGDAVTPWVRTQVGRLAADAAALADALAVLHEADLPLARRVAGLQAEAAVVALEDLVRSGLADDGHPLRLRHPLIRTAVEAALGPARGAELHAGAAAELAARDAEPERIAAHLASTPGREDRAVVALLRRCAAHAAARGAPEAAIPALERALAEPPAPSVLGEVLLELGTARHTAGADGAAATLARANDAARDPAVRARAAAAIPWAAGAGGDLEGAGRRIDASLAELGDPEGDLALDLEAARLALGALDPARRPDVAHVRRLADLPATTPARCALVALAGRQLMDEGLAAREVAPVVERALASPAREGLLPDGLWFLSSAVVLITADRLDAAEAALRWARETAAARGTLRGFALACQFAASLRLRRGDVAGAEAEARAAIDVGVPDPYHALLPAGMLVDALVEAGRTSEARQALAERDLLGTMPAPRPFTVLLYSRARLRAAEGDAEGALADAEAAHARVARHGTGAAVGLDGILLRARLLGVLGRHGEARALADDALVRARRWGTPGHEGAARRAQALLREGDERIAGLTEAVALLERSPAGLERIHARIGRGGGRGAPRDRGAARHRRAGAPAHRAEGAAALTPSELRVVRLAAEGRSNPEIAQALFVTRKTVEMHLGHAYRKLGVSSRSALADALGPG